MSETVEFDLSVDKVTVAKGEDRVYTVALKGEKAVVLDRVGDAPKGFELIDVLEVKLTIKCGMNETLEELGIDQYMSRKVVVLRDRDRSLQSFEAAMEQPLSEAMQYKLV
jgi:hypothetical protein